MSDTISQFLPWIIAILACLAFILVTWKVVSHVNKTGDKRLIKRLFNKHNQKFLKDVSIADGLDGLLFVDYLLLIRGNIVALKIMTKPGYIFGAEKIDEWTCVHNNHTEKFTNPLVQLNLFSQEVKRNLNFHAIKAYALFGSESKFEKGLPQGVLPLKDFAAELDQLTGNEAEHEAAELAWDELITLNTNSPSSEQ